MFVRSVMGVQGGGTWDACECDSDVVDAREFKNLTEFYLVCLGHQWDSMQQWIVVANIDHRLILLSQVFSSVDHCSFDGVTCHTFAFEWIGRNDP